MTDSCKTCRFLHGESKSCRRYPPQIIGESTTPSTAEPGGGWRWCTTFPVMDPDLGWCGEHKTAVTIN